MDRPELEAAFAAIVRRLGDPDDRRDRRRAAVWAAVGAAGLAVALVALVAGWSPWVAAVGLPAMAAADLVGILTLRRWLRRRRPGPRG